ncbi:helix-turn-helix domain-containing protein [Micromonospora sp. Mcm103]|uniref:helix-turn-helix domain-containing protein n=1 Tax=Micromonospora sp. Mcm103 TaxID=2926015 RepID=UPI0021C68262|nr:helix-turn-helix domain-containing protein [Micromonospora sp. Mcm103]
MPAHLAGAVRRILVVDLAQHVRTDGGAPTAALRALLYALARGEHHHDQAADRFATETPNPAGRIVEISTDDAAALLECSPQHVRRLCRSGGVSARRAGRRAWLIDAADLDRYRHRRNP